MVKSSGKMTLERLAAMMMENFQFFQSEMREELRRELGTFREEMKAKLSAIHNRLDDLSLNRATRDDLAGTNARVSRVERHLGLA